jgi:hypothetical protein
MRQLLSSLAALMGAALALGVAGAQAATITPGGSLTGVGVDGTDSVYQVFGHSGSAPFTGVSTDGVLIDFAASSGNVFTFTATGAVSCCNDAPNIPPDGFGSGMNVGGLNGLSGLSGDLYVPLVGVFTTEADPSGGVAPGSLAFDADTPTALSPLLHQVFYIGDGRAGLNNAMGALLTFTAPTSATRLYLGAIDALAFSATSGSYDDNQGAWTVNVGLAAAGPSTGPVPEPATWALMIGGFGLAGAALRRRRALAPA